MATHRRLVDLQGADFYPTPAWGTRALLKYVSFRGAILEPCCGDGAMADVIKAHGYEVTASDVHDRGYGAVRDFFDVRDRVANVVTNPPFNIAEAVLAHALRIADHQVCLLLRTAFLESRRRYEQFYRDKPPSRVLVFSERLSMYPKGYEAQSGGTTSFSWFCWDLTDASGETKITWIEPGLRDCDERQAEMFGA